MTSHTSAALRVSQCEPASMPHFPSRSSHKPAWPLLLLSGLVISLFGVSLSREEKSRPGFIDLPPRDPRSNAELIDALENVDSWGIDFDPVDVVFFLATDSTKDFDPEDYGVLPAPTPPLRELVMRGTKALPDLLAHIDDKRPTTIRLTTEWTDEQRKNEDRDREIFAAGLYLADRYAPRHLPSKTIPPFPRIENEIEIETHYVTVGDLCYVAIGQIVNRDYHVIGYGGSNYWYIYSPTRSQELAQSLRKDWANLTEEQHRKSLITDAFRLPNDQDDGNYHSAYAVKRLCFYYPEVGEHVLMELLSRPIYDWSDGYSAYKELIAERDPSKWSDLFREIEARYGPACGKGVVLQLIQDRDHFEDTMDSVNRGSIVTWGDETFPSQEHIEKYELAKQLINLLLPRVGGRKALKSIATCDAQQVLIEETLKFQSNAVDRKIADLILRAKQSCKTYAESLTLLQNQRRTLHGD